jgi:putative ABC transport system permease protein
MLKNYIKIAWRSLRTNKLLSFINIAGLAIGMSVVMLIGLWIWDELSYNKNFEHYDRITRVMQSINGNKDRGLATQRQVPMPLAEELRNLYGNDFQQVILSTKSSEHVLRLGDKKITQTGRFMEPGAADMLTLKMLAGSRESLQSPQNILLSASTARALFGGDESEAMDKTIRLDDTANVRVAGIYADLPDNSDFNDLAFLAPFDLLTITNGHVKIAKTEWGNNAGEIFVRLKPGVDASQESAKIKTIVNPHEPNKAFYASVLLHPMSRWHLYSEFKDGINTGGRIQFVWLFGFIGGIILLLACINFMNLSTARSEKRAREVGIRKSVGSLRSQLIGQFFSESLFTTLLAFGLCLLIVLPTMPWFNTIAGKKISIPWENPFFWAIGLGFAAITGLIAGSYPALYLSSFSPVKVLKGDLSRSRTRPERGTKLWPKFIVPGRFAVNFDGAASPRSVLVRNLRALADPWLSRKVLVVIQFTASVMLIVGTVIVYRQIGFARHRPVGYDRQGLVMARLANPSIHQHFNAFREALLATGVVTETAESTSFATEPLNQEANVSWAGSDPNSPVGFYTTGVTPEYGKTVGWQFVDGRDYSRTINTDTFSMVLNEAAVKAIGFKHPVGQFLNWYGYRFSIIGVVKDMVMESPYATIQPALYYKAPRFMPMLNIRLKPSANASDAIAKIEAVFKRFDPAEPLNYKFADDEYDTKFRTEQRIGSLASFFAALAIFISCLGLFGMAAFVTERRTKEVGVRKVLGASVISLWGLLSKEFVLLVGLSVLIATPITWYAMNSWLQNYAYRTVLDWWIFALTGGCALLIALLTISYQVLKAANANPARNLRSE